MKKIEEQLTTAIIASISDTEGNFEIDLESDNLYIEVSGRYNIEQVRDDDYFNGTGYEYISSAIITIERCEVHEYNAGGDEITSTISINEAAIESAVKNQLIA